ncbi:hypothetical protein Sjap_016699 [Stephania japonica]|uniref:Pentatricopeptide repeat-containing protein n=1 Tax=Stephania japonica TaxID=461633 RepID=A0AAP0INF8_9MAGN
MLRQICISVIKQCGTLKGLKTAHAAMIRSHLHLNLYFSTNLITQYASLGSISHAYVLFSSSPTSDLFLWNVMIRGLVENSLYDRSIILYRKMRQLGIKPDNFTFPFVLKACGCLGDVKFGKMVHRDAVEFGLESDVFVANSLITMYGKCEQVGYSRKVFDEMGERSVISWSAMIGACARSLSFMEEGLSLFEELLDAKIVPSRSVVLNVIQCVVREREAHKIFKIIAENKVIDSDRIVRSATIGMYSRCGRIDICRRIFDETVDKDLACWSSMMEAYCGADLGHEALELFREMKVQGIITLDLVTILSTIRAGANLASFHQARFIHGYICRNLLLLHHELIMVETALIDLYTKCGNIEYGRKVFDAMQEKNEVSWNTMIAGYGMHGRGREAIEAFDAMKGVMKPDGITLASVLSACSHSGLVEEGWRCFNSMSREFGVSPRAEHYGCMVDLLGRAGQLNKAKELMEKMGVRARADSSGVWGALLGACRIHCNIEMGELAGRQVLELDSKNPGRYVVLCNIYKSSGKTEHVNEVRGVMKERGVRKRPGHSLLLLL